MKKSKQVTTALAILLVGCMMFGLCGCPAPSDGGGTSTTTSTTTAGTTTGGSNPDAPIPTNYANGAAIAGTGDSLEGTAVLTPTTYNEAAVQDTTAAALRSIFRTGNGLEDNMLLRIPGEGYAFSGAKEYDAKNMVLVLPQGLTIDGNGLVIKNLTVIGPVKVLGTKNVTLENVRIFAPDETALTVAAGTNGPVLKDCRIDGKTAIDSGADGLTILDSYIAFSEAGILDTGADGTYLSNVRLEGSGPAIKTAADNTEIRFCTIKTDKDSVGIEVGEARNVLVGACTLLDAQTSVQLTGTDNAAVVRNSAISVVAQNGKHIYVVDNALGGRLALADNSYLIADGNAYPDDEYNHEAVLSGNNNTNGNSLMDVDKRLSVGADENLLPHVDKEQFLAAPRRATVFDRGEEKTLGAYVMEHAKNADFVIIAPGAYVNDVRWTLDATHKNTVIYGYGVLAERSLCVAKEGDLPTIDSMQPHVMIQKTENVHIKGATFAYERDSAGQVHVAEKLANNQFRAIAAAGFYEDFLKTNDTLFKTSGANIYRNGSTKPLCDYYDFTFVEKRADGSLIFSVSDAEYELLKVGDILTCRNLSGAGAHLNAQYSSGTLYQDVTVYGNSGAACFGEKEVTGAVTYYRVLDTSPAAEIIDKATYDKYKMLEAQYGIHTDVRFDGTYYRGDVSRYSSLDAIHVSSSAVGSQIISCILENMADDGTNQHSAPSRLSTIYKNADGKTATIIYKPLLDDVSYNRGYRQPTSMTHDFAVGDRVYIYTSKGELVCDAPVKTATADAGMLSIEYSDASGQPIKINTYKLTVDAKLVNWDALAGYPLDTKGATTSANNSPDFSKKIIVDNRSYSADGFLVDNTVVRNVRSRGLLFKASDGAAVNCTLENLVMAGISVTYEGAWPESGVVENLRIENNLFNNVATYYDTTPLQISSMGYPNLEKDSVFAHFTIKGNVFKNRHSEYAVVLFGIMDVTLENNDFGSIMEMSGTLQKKAVQMNSVRDVKLENNIYPDTQEPVKNALLLTNIKGLSGSDVQGGEMFPEFK